jgi:ankyrin repeat protein
MTQTGVTLGPTAPKRNLRKLVSSVTLAKDNPDRPWTVDPAILKQADHAMLKKKLFEVVDLDGNGHIHFSEFLALQRDLMSCEGLFDDKLLAFDVQRTKAQSLEKEFRKWDRDFNLGIDELEWEEYIEDMLAAVGKRVLNGILDNLLAKRQQRKLKTPDTIDERCMSERLLEKAMHVHFLGKSHAEQARVLLDKGADPNFVDPTGVSVVSHLSAKCEPTFMAKLLEGGGNPILNSNDFDSPVLVAARARRLEVLRILIFGQTAVREMHPEQFDDDLSLRLVLEMHELQEKQIRELVRNGADINFRNNQGWIPLTSAVFWGRRDAVELLIRLPIINPRLRLSVDVPNLKGRTALHVAARKGKFDLIPLLVGARADVNAKDTDGWTPLHHAVFNSRSEAVRLLYGHGAKMNLRSYRGITPFMLASSSDRVTVPMTADALKLLEPPEPVRFADAILPILKNDSLQPYEKVAALMNLPGVCGVFENLRLYDQAFRMNRGPNRVQLSKLWELLFHDLLTRLRSGEVDLEPLRPHCSDAETADVRHETKLRQEKQQTFVASWLMETAGPPRSTEWTWDNREGYREQIAECVKSEIQGFKAECETMYETLAETPGGAELVALASNEILQQQYMTQLGAHPLLKWIDCADTIEAFGALCDVQTFGRGGDDNEALAKFMELASTDSDFATGSLFWKNVYKLWLSSYASLARPSFHVKMQKFVDDFISKNMEAGFEAVLSDLHAKTFQELKACECRFGQPGYETHDQRVVASKALDAISCCIVANTPAAIAHLVYAFRQCTLAEDKFELVRIQNGFHKDAETSNGLREVIVNIVFKGGYCHGRGAREGHSVQVMLVGEVRIVLSQTASARQGMKLLSEFVDGKFDPQS